MANTKKKTEVPETVDVAEEETEIIEQKKPMKATEVDTSQYIVVKNGFHGRLIYISSRTGEEYYWREFGDEQEIELRELRNAKSRAKAFFENNWFMFDDEYKWVIDYLGVGQYYKHAVSIDGFDDLFKKTPSEIEKIVKAMSVGQKQSLAYKTRLMISNGDIDSYKVISAIEKALEMELIEKD